MIVHAVLAASAALLGPAVAPAQPLARVPATYTMLADAAPGAGPQPVLVMGGRTVPAAAADLVPGQQVTVTVRGATGDAGRIADAVLSGRAAVTAVSAAAVAALPTELAGAHTLTIVPVTNAAGDDGTGPDGLRQEARQLGDFWSAQTSGTLTVADGGITVHDWVTDLPIAAGDCDADQWKDAALAALGRTEDSFTGRDHLVVYLGKESNSCGWTGLGYMPGNVIWLNGYTAADAFEHEFGHNLGLGHAGDRTCTYTISGAACETDEYGDYDVMGYARDGDGLGLNTAKADQLGLLTSVTPAAGTRVTLAPRTSRSGVRAVKVTGTAGTYYVEYRPAGTGEGEQDSPSPGVQVRTVAAGDDASTLLPAPRYTGDADPASVALADGQAMALPGTGFDVVHESGTVVYLRTAATAAITAPALQSPADGGTSPPAGTISWGPGSADPGAVAGYLLAVDDEQYLLPPGTRTRSVTLAAGSHTVTVATLGLQGGVSGTSTATFTASDASRPAAPKVTFPAQAATTTVVRWRPVAGAAKYTVTVDKATRTVPAGTTKLVLTLARGRHTVSVRTYDTRGVASDPASATITVARTWRATAGKITAPRGGATVPATATLAWAAPPARTGDPAVAGYDIRVDGGRWVTVSAATRARTVKLARGRHTLTVRTRYEGGATAPATVKVTR